MQRTSPAETAYLTFLNTLSHAAIVADGDLVVLANSSAEALLGYPPGGLEGMALAELAPDGRPASIVTAPVPGWAGADDPPWEVRLRHRDGHTVLTDIGWRRVVLDGRPLLQIVERDSGTRLRAAALVRTSEERLRAAILVTNLGIFEHDHVRDEVYWSPEQRAIHGWDPNQPVTHADFIAAVHPEDRARVIDSVARAHDPAGDGRWEIEHRIVRPDGEMRWLHARSQTSFAPRDGRMRPARTVGAVADITAERAAVNLQQMFQLSIDQASDAIYWLGPDGSLVYVNDEACRSLGYSHEELSHLRLWDIDPTYTAEAWSARWADFERLSRPWVQRIESRHRRKDGTTFPVDVVAQHLPVRDSALHVAYVRDLSERRRLEAQLLQAQKMESIGRLAGGIAHDFNNLLTVIQGNVALALLDAPADGPIHGALQEVIKASDSATTLTRQLLAFARNEVIRPQVLDLNEAVTHLGAILRRLLGEDVHLQLDLD
ncbi:MAG: PAS domain S-box protein, partial [Acidimicrobiales bacterium]